MPTLDPKEKITQAVNNHPGIKGMELVLTLFSSSEDAVRLGETFESLIEELVQNGDLIELEYVVPTMDYRCKSLYFPKGTELRVVNKKGCQNALG